MLLYMGTVAGCGEFTALIAIVKVELHVAQQRGEGPLAAVPLSDPALRSMRSRLWNSFNPCNAINAMQLKPNNRRGAIYADNLWNATHAVQTLQ